MKKTTIKLKDLSAREMNDVARNYQHMSRKNQQRYEPVRGSIIMVIMIKIIKGKLGFGICARLELKIAGGNLLEVQQEIAQDPHIVAVSDVPCEMDTGFIGKFKDTPDLT